ncbi:ATP12 ATPase [Actibacterium atlanticum]|uniref:ATP12 ATPase n=1 Tax=Actibacterium atlanticum TaxID=1461693 RepID=A0A058ZME0_9RHOB|nr:ATP12 family protein [Actibacterium atlanticum]KCV82759.1 ATP12 ATPase [Actibacterium atlanticum]
MSDWKAKRFWEKADATQVEGGFSVTLDGRAIKTPAKSPLVMPSMAMALAVAKEWGAQEDQIDPRTMPVTRSANAAIDKVTPQFAEVADLIAAYGGSDLLCYRADGPDTLVKRQKDRWDPLLERAKQEFEAPLNVTSGVIPVAQPEDSLANLSKQVHAQTPFQLAGLHDLVSISGSLILGLAATRGWADLDELWGLSRIDETWQEEQWGEDEEATALAESKRLEFLHAASFYELANPNAGAA